MDTLWHNHIRVCIDYPSYSEATDQQDPLLSFQMVPATLVMKSEVPCADFLL